MRAPCSALNSFRLFPRRIFESKPFTPRALSHPWSCSSPRRQLSTGRRASNSASLHSSPTRRAQHPPGAEIPQLPLGEPLEAGAYLLLVAVALVSVGAALCAVLIPQQQPLDETVQESNEEMVDAQAEAQPGRVGNLTPEQEDKLRKLWAAIFQVCAVGDQDDVASSVPSTAPSEKTAPKDKPRKRSLFSRKGRRDRSDTDSTSTSMDDTDDKYGQNKQFYETLANSSPEAIRATIWAMVKHDHPDALALRFLRARKWDVEKALVMLVSTMNWRSSEMHVDDDIMLKGEAGMVEMLQSSDSKEKQLGEDFLAQIRMGKSYLHGLDKNGRPLCVVRVRLHHQGEQCEESLERYTVYLIETARMVLRPPVDTATIVFDMTGFSMANMDYTPVKFMIKCFEANYPESLGSVLVHKAPWIFQGIWKIIKGWLDPVVASKVHFTNNLKDLEDFIDRSRVIKELDGEEDWVYKYVEPVAGENDKMKDTTTRDGLLAAREQLYKDYEEATLKWINSPEDASVKAQRNSIASKLRADYWVLDPYVRARSLYDRTGWILGDKVDPYPTTTSEKITAAAGNAEIAADDVD